MDFEITEETRQAAVDRMIDVLLFERIDDRSKFEEAFDAVVALIKAQPVLDLSDL